MLKYIIFEKDPSKKGIHLSAAIDDYLRVMDSNGVEIGHFEENGVFHSKVTSKNWSQINIETGKSDSDPYKKGFGVSYGGEIDQYGFIRNCEIPGYDILGYIKRIDGVLTIFDIKNNVVGYMMEFDGSTEIESYASKIKKAY